MIFISEPWYGLYYFAELSPKGDRKYIWSTMPVLPTAADALINVRQVPYHIKKQAYRYFYEARCAIKTRPDEALPSVVAA